MPTDSSALTQVRILIYLLSDTFPTRKETIELYMYNDVSVKPTMLLLV